MAEYVKLGQVPNGDRSGSAEIKRRANDLIQSRELIELRRQTDAIQIPSGESMTLPAGTKVRITQSLGGTLTVTTNIGYMVRIAGQDADALGLETLPAPSPTAEEGQDTEKLAWEQLKTCFDPEIPVNIVDLGLVYHCQVAPLAAGGKKVEVKFTLTAPGCGMGDVLKQDIESKLMSVPDVKEVEVEIVLDPPWDASRMSDAAKLQLGML
jgi:probable FeS assembly SUF system protein SufT